MDCDVVVIGGGPAGAAAAARLAGRGFATALIDRAEFPRDKVCGDFVGPTALAELADLGVARTAAFEASNRLTDLALHIDHDPAVVLGVPQVSGLPGHGRVIPRRQLDAWILDAARQAGATILDGRKADAVRPGPDAVTVTGGDANRRWQVRARLLLGADGSNSLVARTLHGGPPPGRDRILAVRVYVDDVAGPDGQGDVWIRSDVFPGYHWLFPAGAGSANLGVGMLAATYPRSARNLREMLLTLIAEDASLRGRLGGARLRDKILGHPLTTYHPRRPLVGDRVMLLGDAAGLINPLNGEGIQYALHSARWAAEVAADCLADGRLDAPALAGYQRRVRQNLHAEMALSRLFVELIRNRRLNQVWLGALRSMLARAQADPDYAHLFGCVLSGLTPDAGPAGPRIFGQAIGASLAGESWRRLRTGRPTRPGDRPAGQPIAAAELARWAGGTGRALAEVSAQLARSAGGRVRSEN